MIHYFGLVPFSYIVRPILTFLLNNHIFISYGISGGISLIVLASLASAGILPLFFFASIVIVAALSSVILFLPKVIRYFVQKFNPLPVNEGKEIEHFAALHDPSLPRNPAMDIYNPDNAIEIELSNKELNAYYKSIRCLVKQKEFVPVNESSVSKFKGLSKKEALLASEDPAQSEAKVTLTTTKAKAVHIKHALTLIEQLGVANESKLKSALEKDYNHYRLGVKYPH